MMGRSSRSRGVCEGVLYLESDEKSSLILDRLKRQSVTALQELERVIILIEKKQKD
jgi:hypothetical protein